MFRWRWRGAVFIVAAFGCLAVASSRCRAQTHLDGALRRIGGNHITIVTDLPSDAEVDGLPAFFDQAVPVWGEYFGVASKKQNEWHVTGYLMKDKARFTTAGLVPADLPDFRSGYARARELWLFDQSSEYYRRHLLLHEGTHAFMQHFLGGMGAPWYAEGIAELLATHRFAAGALELRYFPRNKGEVPRLGRIEMVQTAYGGGHGMSLERIMQYDSQAHLQDEPYGWCWAAAAFLDGHPRYRERFRELSQYVQRPDFSANVKKLYAEDWRELSDEWQVFVANLTHGYDFERMQTDFKPGSPLPPQGTTVAVKAAHGWQASGVRLQAGKTYRLKASGRYQVAEGTPPWMSEPAGVTIRYFNGQPLGMLLGAVRPDEPGSVNALIRPIAIGLETTVTPKQTGILYLRINDAAGKLGDNVGNANVQITAK